MTGIELSNADAKLFLLFREHQTSFSKMVEMGVFEKDNISVVLYFDKFSSLRAIDKTKRLVVNDKQGLKFANNLESSIM